MIHCVLNEVFLGVRRTIRLVDVDVSNRGYLCRVVAVFLSLLGRCGIFSVTGDGIVPLRVERGVQGNQTNKVFAIVQHPDTGRRGPRVMSLYVDYVWPL